MTYYEVITENGEVLGSFADFAEAYKHRVPGTTIRYWAGEFYVLNVTVDLSRYEK